MNAGQATEDATRIAAARTAIQRARANYPLVDLANLPATRGAWSLRPESLQFLVSLVSHLRPTHVLEFGSGLSTRVLAWACAEYSEGSRLSSIDHDPEFSSAAEDALAAEGEGCPVAFQLAPLVIRDCGGELLPVYSLRKDQLATPHPPELVSVDGPPVVLGGREGTLYQVLDLSMPGTLVVLDDASRSEEQGILRRWELSLADAIDVHPLPELGMAAIVVEKAVRSDELWYFRARLVAARLSSLVPPGERFLLVDDDLLGEELRSLSLTESNRALPFPARDGQYSGRPADGEEAVAELEQARATAGFIVFAWPALWWLDYYEELAAYLEEHARCAFADERVVVFDLRR